MNQYQRAKLNKILLIVSIVLVVIAVGIGIFYFITSSNSNTEPEGYEDTVIAKDIFEEMTIDLDSKIVKVDNKETSFQEEFGIPNEQADLILSSEDELKKYFASSTFEMSIDNNLVKLKNPYQTKTLLVQANEIRDDFDAIDDPIQVQEGLFILKYDTQKRTKAALEYIKEDSNATNIVPDEYIYVKSINDESQTVYGESEEQDSKMGNSYGVSAMGLNNYKKIIQDNGNPENIVIATIGYGAAIDNTYFKGKISEDYYNFTDSSKNITETIPQGSRTLEVIKESTTDNIKILPLVVINADNYTTVSNIIQAISYASQKADVICYEFVHKPNDIIKSVLENTFKANIPICCVTSNNQDNQEMFPANDGTTIAISSVDKALKTTSYSATGDFIDFVASSTDVKEIFSASSTVSRWSGAQYSNAHVASLIALIKTYHKNFTILEIYNFIKTYCQDLGSEGKDAIYGHGFPNFSKIKISDLDKDSPQLSDIAVDDSEWQKSKKFQIQAKDNIKIYGWNVTKTSDVPKDWKRTENIKDIISISEEIEENGKYYVWVVDTAGNAISKNFEIQKIDKVAPTIQYQIDDSKLETEKSVTISASATDNESGLHDMPYSWDKTNWGTDNTMLRVTTNGTYTVYVRDKLENIAEKKITISNIPERGTAVIDEGTIIKSIEVSDKWEGNINKEVTITFNDNLDIKRRKITDADVMPEEFRPQQSEEENNNNNNNNDNNNNDNNNNNYYNYDNNSLYDNTIQDTNVTETNAMFDRIVSFTPIDNNSLQGHTNVTITLSLEIGKKYYIWIEDSLGNVTSQGFYIKKVE